MAIRVAVGNRGFAVGAFIMAAALAACGASAPLSDPGRDPTASGAPGPTRVPGAASMVPSQVEIVCGPGAPELSTPVVTASRDGVRIGVTAEFGWHLDYQSDADCDSAGDCDAVTLIHDREVLSLPIRPGEVRLACAPPDLREPPMSVALQVVDPLGWYRPAVVDPSLTDCIAGSATEERNRGIERPPLAQAVGRVGNRQPGDWIERGGWPTDTGTVRIVRGGVVIGRLTFQGDDTGGWLLVGWILCGGLTLEPG